MWKPTALFLALAFGLSSIFYVIVNVTQSVNPWIILLMWMPALGAILACLMLKRPLSTLGFGRWSTRYVLIGYFIPIAYCLIASLGIWTFGFGGFPNLTTVNAWAQTAGIATLPPWSLILLFIIINGLAGMLFGIATALGEEIGWRGFLVPELYKHLPFAAVALISGLIWASWHYAITGVVYKDAALPSWFWLGTFTVVAVAISFVMAWLRIKSGSIWPSTFLHASHNLFMQSIFTPLTTENEYTKWVAGDLGLAFLVVALIVALGAWLRRDALPTASEFAKINEEGSRPAEKAYA